MNIVLLLLHSIEEFDQVKLLTELGHNVFSPGAYVDPRNPSDDKRPAVDAPHYADLAAACDAKRQEHAGELIDGRDPIDWAKADLPDEVLDWADVIICHHAEHTFLVPQWPRLHEFIGGAGRVVWRTVGQSVEGNERLMAPLRAEGLEIVRYSPKEANIPGYIGHDAIIRFYKDPDEFGPWTGDIPAVINITQHLRQRDPFTNWRFWDAATQGLPAIAMGPGSEVIGGTGALTYPKMKEMLRRSRAYLYTGTQPASYTLGLIEAMMSGIPVVSIGPQWMDVFPYGPDLFEGHEIANNWEATPSKVSADDWLQWTRGVLWNILSDNGQARAYSKAARARAIELFGKPTIAAQWAEYLR